ncbi:MAG: hypothetical protein AB8F74_20010 [Saprospiraceae bacterium]
MKTVKILSSIAITFLMALFYIILTVQNPLAQEYNVLVQDIMDKKELISESEVLNQYPEVKKLKGQIQDIYQTYYDIQRITQHPIPPEKEESVQLLSQIKELKTMKGNVNIQIAQISDKIIMDKIVMER